MSKFGAFVEGLAGGMERGQALQIRNEKLDELKDQREGREKYKQTLARFSELGSGIPTDHGAFLGSQQGPPLPADMAAQATTPTLQSLGPTASIAEMRQLIAQEPDKDRREHLKEQLEDFTMRSSAFFLGGAERYIGEDPGKAMPFLTKVAEMMNVPPDFFRMSEDGKEIEMAGGGTLDKDTFNDIGLIVHAALKNPVEGRALARQFEQEAADALMDERRMQVYEGTLEAQWAQIEQGWEKLGLDLKELNQRKHEFAATYRLEVKKFEKSAELMGEQGAYYAARAAAANAQADALGQTRPWESEAQLVAAINGFSEEVRDSQNMISLFTPEKLEELNAGRERPLSEQDLRQMVIAAGGAAITEHGASAVPSALMGVVYTTEVLSGNLRLPPGSVGDDGNGRWFMVVEGERYAISGDAAARIAARQEADQQATQAGYDRQEQEGLDFMNAQGAVRPERAPPARGQQGRTRPAAGITGGELWDVISSHVKQSMEEARRYGEAQQPRGALPL
jgi:hypothetical protein